MEFPSCGINEMLKMIDGPNSRICRRIYRENRRLFCLVQGSTNNHQAWKGGYHDHIQEAMRWGLYFYTCTSLVRTLPFSLSDLLLVVFLHDIEKPWKYELGPRGQLQHKNSLNSKKAHREFRDKKLGEYGIILSVEQDNAMKYAEGELDDYTNQRRMMNELAGFVHICDVLSARVFHNYPRKKLPTLSNAQRVAEII